MIEVEQKFILDNEQIKSLAKGAEFLGKHTFTDIYYDTPEYSLTLKDTWLRSREGGFELKVPLQQDLRQSTNQYKEIDDKEGIRQFLQLLHGDGLEDDLERAGYTPFCTCRTDRTKYRKESFTIDLDQVYFNDFSYALGEIELLVDNVSEINDATEKILSFAQKHQLNITDVKGKVIVYLERMKPKHYQALVRAGVVRTAS